MFLRVSEFKPPPLVERSALPPELQNKKTVYDKFSNMIHNKYIEKHERKDKTDSPEAVEDPAVQHEATVLKPVAPSEQLVAKIKRRDRSFDKGSKSNSGTSTPDNHKMTPRVKEDAVSLGLELEPISDSQKTKQATPQQLA
jgi:hypothetical protein